MTSEEGIGVFHAVEPRGYFRLLVWDGLNASIIVTKPWKLVTSDHGTHTQAHVCTRVHAYGEGAYPYSHHETTRGLRKIKEEIFSWHVRAYFLSRTWVKRRQKREIIKQAWLAIP